VAHSARPQRLVNKLDFERLLAVRPCGRSAHFALHHVAQAPVQRPRLVPKGGADELSTSASGPFVEPVDSAPDAVWFGAMMPKRQARRAATRSLLKRQVRSAFDRHAATLAPGLWLVRLRAGFAVADFPSAQSPALAIAVRQELDALLGAWRPARAAERTRRGAAAGAPAPDAVPPPRPPAPSPP
jgi:ribonuclease P protein component